MKKLAGLLVCLSLMLAGCEYGVVELGGYYD